MSAGAVPDDLLAKATKEVDTLKLEKEMLSGQMTALVTLFNNASAWDMNGVMDSNVTLPAVLVNLFLGPPTKDDVKKSHAKLETQQEV